jgi:transcriptional regulator with XRE-family HTH domain
MAAALQVTTRTISNYENGNTRPNRATLIVWADVCDADLDLLIRVTGWIDVEIPVAA